MDEGMYKAMHLTSCNPLKFYGLPKFHKTGTPLGLLFLAGAQLPMGWPGSSLKC